jgi:hypothetical protein
MKPITHQATGMINDVVTIIHDPKNPLGKRFAADGSKSANVQVSQAFTEQRFVPTAKDMAAVIMEVSNDPNAALINASFRDIPMGETFIILSENQFGLQLGIKTREAMAGVHSIKIGGKTYKAVGRFKENVQPSSWQILDRDIDAHTPPQYANLSNASWLIEVDKLLPGLSTAARISTQSTSARVVRKGKVLGQGNGHTWVQFQDPSDVERVRTVLQVKAMELGLSWKKPRHSRSNPGEIVGYGFATILDISVFTPGRLIFNGKPTVAPGLTVKPQKAVITPGTRLDTSKLVIPAAEKVRSISRTAGLEIQLRKSSSGGLAVHAQDLHLSTEIELRDGTITTVATALSTLPSGEKLRCQTPFRESNSEAAFLSRGGDGKPFIYDSGTSTTHWLNDAEAKVQGHTSFADNGLPLGELLDHFKTLSDEQLKEQWAAQSVHLPQGDVEEVLEFVKEKTKRKLRSLKASLSDAKKAKHKHQLQDRAAGREMIMYTPEDLTRLTARTEGLILASTRDDEYIAFGGVLSQLRDKEIPYTHLIDSISGTAPKVPVLEPIDEYGIRALVERVAVFQVLGHGGWTNIAVPQKILETLIRKKLHAAKTVNGLLTHPIVLLDGVIVSTPGLHNASGLYLHGLPMKGMRQYSQAQAKTALKRLKEVFLEGFEFETKRDATVALSALFTGVVRRILDQAPGYAFLAPIQSSGKTTLARRVHVILTGRDMPVTSFAEQDETEMEKRMLAMLLSSPAMICFDNITDGTTFRSAVISRVMTSPIFTGRILGLSRDADCPTNVLLIVTGNNLSMGADEISRWLPAYLNPQTARPHERTFKNADVVSHALSMRESVLQDVIGIIAGYIASKEVMPTASRFARWDCMVRQPIMWAQGDDIAQIFRENAANSEANGAAVALLLALQDIYGSADFGASQVAGRVALMYNYNVVGTEDTLREALSSMKCKDPRSSSSVGRALHSIVNKRVETRKGELILKSRHLDGLSRYRVT